MAEKINDGDALRYLAYVYAKEEGQPNAGFRNTREVADFLRVKTPTARRILERLFEKDLVIGYDGHPITWCITNEGRAEVTRSSSMRSGE